MVSSKSFEKVGQITGMRQLQFRQIGREPIEFGEGQQVRENWVDQNLRGGVEPCRRD
jgi:hypothetical protein